MSHTRFPYPVFSVLLFAGVLIDTPIACSHRDRMKDIDHLAFINAASTYVNIEVVLHFHEFPSQQIREGRMDADENGKITPAELDQYCSALDEKILRRFSLKVDGKPVPLVSLYRPEVDLLGNDQSRQCPHLLKIFLTANLPEGTSSNTRLQFDDRSFSSITGQSRMEVRKELERKWKVFKVSHNRGIVFSQSDVEREPEKRFSSDPPNQ